MNNCKLNTIQNIQKNLAIDLQAMNDIITKHLLVREDLVNIVSKYLLNAGGKRIRPLLTVLTSKMFGYTGIANIQLGAAVEFIHTATLLHDDVVDSSTMRRFNRSANSIWGNKTSILVGDFLFSQSFKLMVSAGSNDALTCLSTASAIIAEGEISQLVKLNQKRILTIEEYEEIIKAKTAVLFGAACEVGAIIAKANKVDIELIKNFGINLGQIFQIVDDFLDYFGNDQELGKKIGDDFIEGKVTLPLILLYNKWNTDPNVYKRKLHKLESMIAKSKRSVNDFLWVQKMLNSYKIKQDIMEYIYNIQSVTSNIMQQIQINNSYKNFLNELVDFSINRSF